MKRALLGADSNETIILLRLAKLCNDLEDYREAAMYHQRVIDVSVAGRTYTIRITVANVLILVPRKTSDGVG